jgi:PleD family two-component response regulator
MSRLQRVLLVDDQYDEFQDQVAEDFQQNNIGIDFCRTKDEAIDLVNMGIHFDLVILDWFLDGDESLLSRLFLKELRQKSFVLVFIWSEHIDHFNATQPEEIDYPETLIEGIGKGEVTADILHKRIARRFQESLTAQISSIYRNTIRFGLEKVFFDLVQLPNQDIASLLKFLVGDRQNIGRCDKSLCEYAYLVS